MTHGRCFQKPDVENFNSHARVGRDRELKHFVFFMQNFNSHARVGRDPDGMSSDFYSADFNSHARVGRDDLEKKLKYATIISTHTPA